MVNNVKWSINNSCNMNCPYCFADNSFKVQSFEEKCKVLDKLHDMGVVYVDFFGKEPLVNDEIFKLCDYATSKGYDFYFSFISNGKNLNKYQDDIIKSPIQRFTISYDCGNTSRDFNVDTKDLAIFRQNGFCIELSLDVHRFNLEYILEQLNTFYQYGVTSLYFNPIVPMGKRSDKTKEYSITESEYEDFIGQILYTLDNNYDDGICIKIPFEFVNLTKKYSNIPYIDGVSFSTEPTCTSGITHFFISCDGYAYGCVSNSYVKSPINCDFLNTPKDEIFSILGNHSSKCRLCKGRC